MLKHSPIRDAREKHAVEPVLSLIEKRGALDYLSAVEALILQNWAFAKRETKWENQIRGRANRAVHAQQESARLKRKRMAAEEDVKNCLVPQRCTSTESMDVASLGQ